MPSLYWECKMLQAFFIHSTNTHWAPLIAITTLMLQQHTVMYAAGYIDLDICIYIYIYIYIYVCIYFIDIHISMYINIVIGMGVDIDRHKDMQLADTWVLSPMAAKYQRWGYKLLSTLCSKDAVHR